MILHLFPIQHGFIGGVMQLLLLNLSAHLTKQLGMAPGGEFRRAFKEVTNTNCYTPAIDGGTYQTYTFR